MADLTSIRNIGPAMAVSLQRAGIQTAEDLRAIGADEAYSRLLQSGHKPHFIGYYILHMALQGRPWNDCKGAEKNALRQQFDRIKAEYFDTDRAAFEQALDALGVRNPM